MDNIGDIQQERIIDVVRLSDELSMRRYLFGKGNAGDGLELKDYVALVIASREEAEAVIYDGRTYLSDLSHRMRMTTRQTSQLVGNLRDRGLVDWTHDGDGSEGTYITLTDRGRSLLEHQRSRMAHFNQKVIDRFGQENLIELLSLMRELDMLFETITEDEANEQA